ncbi:hypothetical protein B0H19DRAFT_1104391 [Mycena capillaripes]|nr:hypothetical protein B0H19DRAFT_1104391 [Mycena capillaripes]
MNPPAANYYARYLLSTASATRYPVASADESWCRVSLHIRLGCDHLSADNFALKRIKAAELPRLHDSFSRSHMSSETQPLFPHESGLVSAKAPGEAHHLCSSCTAHLDDAQESKDKGCLRIGFVLGTNPPFMTSVMLSFLPGRDLHVYYNVNLLCGAPLLPFRCLPTLCLRLRRWHCRYSRCSIASGPAALSGPHTKPNTRALCTRRHLDCLRD